MEHETSAAERMLLEAGFRARRRHVLRAQGHVVAAGLLGLGAIAAARHAAPEAFGTATACFVLATLAALLRLWWVAHRAWRCPACEVRWEAKDTLASFSWNHCPDCGAPLRAYPEQGERERAAQAAFALDRRSPEELLADFQRRRRRALAAAGTAMVAGLVALVSMQERGLGEALEQAVSAGFAAVVLGTMLWASRCPRCETGLLGPGRHCQRCGLRLADPDPSGDPAPPVPR